MQIVRDADALPPNPRYTETEAFLRPLPLLPDIRQFFDYDLEQRSTIIDDFTNRFYEVTDNLDRTRLSAAQQSGQLWQFLRQNLPLPPKPLQATQTEYENAVRGFLQQYADLIPRYQAEWGYHEAFSDAMENIAISGVYSPFVPAATVQREINNARDRLLAGLSTPSEAAQRACDRINNEIQRALLNRPQLQELYDARCRLQLRIDQLKDDGEPIPLEWITNTFYRRYYSDHGLAEEPSAVCRD